MLSADFSAETEPLDDLKAFDDAVDDVDEEELDRFLQRLEKSLLSGSANEDPWC